MSEMINNIPNPVESNNSETEEVSEGVGERLSKLRLAHGLSQRKLASLAGLTNGAISTIEQERVSPSVASLKKLLEVFGLSLAEFFADDFEPTTKVFFTAREMPQISKGMVGIRQVGRDMTNRKLQVLHETYQPGGDTGLPMITHAGEESGVVVRGEIEITVGNQSQVLVAGDSYYFSSRLPHRFRNPGADVCEIVSACTPPTF